MDTVLVLCKLDLRRARPRDFLRGFAEVGARFIISLVDDQSSPFFLLSHFCACPGHMNYPGLWFSDLGPILKTFGTESLSFAG